MVTQPVNFNLLVHKCTIIIINSHSLFNNNNNNNNNNGIRVALHLLESPCDTGQAASAREIPLVFLRSAVPRIGLAEVGRLGQ